MIFRVQILDGKGFGQDTQALVCCASFAGTSKTTQYSVAAQEHIWNSTLTWSVSRDELRSATSNTNHCKVSVLRRDGTSLGWVVISLRSAKLQGQYRSDPQGLWLQLNASKLSEPPQVRVAYSLLDERHLPSGQKRDSPIIMQHSDSSSSLSSRASTEPSSSAGSTQAEPDVERKQAARQEEARRGQRSAAASLRPSRAGSTAGRALDPVPAAAGNAASIATEPPSSTETPHDAVAEAEAAEGGGALAGHQYEGEPSPAASAIDGCDADATVAVEAGTSQQQPDDAQQHLSPAGSGTLHLPRPSGSAAHLGDVEQSPPEMPGGYQQQEDQQLQQQEGDWRQQECVAGAAMGLSTGQSAPEGVAVASPACAAEPSSSHSSGTRPSNSQLRVVGDDALAVAEANLPSFAQRQRQQQQHAQPEHLHQQQPQRVADQGMARASSPQATSQVVEVAQLGPSATAGAAQEAADAGLQPDASDTPTSMAPLAGESSQHLQAPGGMDSLAAATASTTDASAAIPADKQAALHAAVLAVSATTTAAAEVVAEAAPGASAPLDSSTAAAAAAAPGSEQPADGQAAAPDTSLPVCDPVRNFTLTLDLRTFQAGRRLPVALGSIYVTAWLPQELIAFLGSHCNTKLPPRLTPLKTKPAVDISRGSEGALPSGSASVSFTCGVMALAGLLAAEPRVMLEVWHKERLRSDLLLGVASLPLSALLQECWVDGYSPVYAIMTKASAATAGSSSSSWPQHNVSQEVEEKVQVGLLRVVMSLEEKGPAVAAPAAFGAGSGATTPGKQQQQQRPDSGQSPAAAEAAAHLPDQGRSPQHQPQSILQPAAGAAAPEGAAAAGSQGFRQMPEYLVAWELEVWRKAEEARFRAQLQELEQQRLGVIEAAWRAREAQRQSEIAAMKAKYVALETQTRELLTAAQDRERALLAAEAELCLRKAELERVAAARMTEAEAAVRRLQVECEHQLGLERERTAAALKQRDAAESRTVALEAQFTEYVASQRNAPESQLKAELAEAQRASKAAEAKLQAALKLKQKYKQQVQQLAQEVAALHHKQQQDILQQHQQQLAAALAREQDGLAAAQQAELTKLREELGKLRAAAMAADPAAFGARGLHSGLGLPTASSSSRGSSYKHAERQSRQRKGRYLEDKENHQQHSAKFPQQLHRQHQQHPQRKTTHHDHQQQHGSASSSGTDSDNSLSSTSSSGGLLHSAAERSARETAAEVATLAAMLNPPRRRSSRAAPAEHGPDCQQPGAQAAADAKQQGQQEGSVQLAAPPMADSSGGCGGSSGSSPMAEVRRLLKEKGELLATGLYERDDPVIMQIDARVQALAEQAAVG